jgi:hypothetical protein
MQRQTAAARLRVGDPAPEAAVQGPDGPVSLSDLWAHGPVVLTFLRHYG